MAMLSNQQFGWQWHRRFVAARLAAAPAGRRLTSKPDLNPSDRTALKDRTDQTIRVIGRRRSQSQCQLAQSLTQSTPLTYDMSDDRTDPAGPTGHEQSTVLPFGVRPSHRSLLWVRNTKAVIESPVVKAGQKLFPKAARTRAVELLLLGALLAREERFANKATAVLDVWRQHMMAHAVSRPKVIDRV
jgi:hypothetical protein